MCSIAGQDVAASGGHAGKQAGFLYRNSYGASVWERQREPRYLVTRAFIR